MEKFDTFCGIVCPLDRSNVDNDVIIPKQYLKSVKRTGFAADLFDDWRYLDRGEPDMENAERALNPDFVLNDPRYAGAQILLARENFGCGSSREHAPWALREYGFKVIIAPSFGDIFFNNSFHNGLLCVRLDGLIVDALFRKATRIHPLEMTVDLAEQNLTLTGDQTIAFEMDAFRKYCLLEGLDAIGPTARHGEAVRAYERQRKIDAPWLS